MAKRELPEVQLEDVVVSSEPIQTKEIKVEGRKPFTLSYRAMSWLDKSACVSKATEFFLGEDGTPQTMFNINIYFREALKKMLVDFPFPISDKVLNGLTPEMGVQLQEFIPSPLGEGTADLVAGSETRSKGAKKTPSSTATQSK